MGQTRPGRACRLADLDGVPRRGFVDGPSPVTALPVLARELGLAWFGAKRDDLLPTLHGGAKVRKLDTLLAAQPWRDASRWTSVGAIGSGQLVALSAAATALGRRLDAHVFWEPPTLAVMANLAAVASGPVSIRFHGGRAGLVLALAPWWLVGGPTGWVPPGASNVEGVLGVVRAGLELAAQVDAGALPAPDEVWLAAGSGGTAVGLAVGLGLGGLRATVRAVSVVEAPLLARRRLDALQACVRERIATEVHGALPDAAPLDVVRGFVGPGYGRVGEASVQACARLARHGVALEAIYGGKAMAALLERATPGRRVLFWVTSHGGGLPVADGWRDRLPPDLDRRLRRSPRARR